MWHTLVSEQLAPLLGSGRFAGSLTWQQELEAALIMLVGTVALFAMSSGVAKRRYGRMVEKMQADPWTPSWWNPIPDQRFYLWMYRLIIAPWGIVGCVFLALAIVRAID